MTFDHPIEIHSLTAPLVVESSVRCDGLNADLVDGHHASEFALSSHLHSASDIDRDYFATARLGEGTATGNKVLFAKADGTRGEWRNVSAYDVTDLTDFGIGLAQTLDAPSARTYLGAAPVSHTHHADEVNAGILSVARLGSGTSSAGHVLFGHPSGGTGFWKTLSYSDVNGSVGYGSSTAYRIPYWGSVGRLENSQIVYDPSYTRGVVRGYVNLGTADLGTSGNLYFTDIGDIDESLAVNFKSIVYRKIKATITGSGSVTVTPNDGAQTLTLTSTGGGGSTPPTTPANAVYVWVVNSGATGGNWYQLTGTA